MMQYTSPAKAVKCFNCKFSIKHQNEYKCLYCQNAIFCSKCIYQHYQKFSHHLKNGKIQMQIPDSHPKMEEKKKISLKGFANLGNSCYMNSCLQCLVATQQITKYFLFGDNYQKQLNKDNPEGSQGKLAQAYANLIKEIYMGKQDYIRPYQLKSMMGTINPNFSRHTQEDAYEFYYTFIDTLQEDLNRIKKKPNSIQPDVYGKPVELGAKLVWLHQISRNQSIITDYLTGLYKCAINCSSCCRDSHTFQKFNAVNLPIPNDNQEKQLKFYVLSDNFCMPIIQSSIQYKNVNKKQLVNSAVKKIGYDNPQNFKLYFLSEFKSIRECKQVQQSEFQNEMRDQTAFLIQLSSMDKQHNNFVLTSFFTKKGEFKPLWIKKPLFVSLNSETGISLTKRILKYLFGSVYTQRGERTIFGNNGKTYTAFENEMQKNKILKLILVKTIRRQNNLIVYEKNKWQEISGDECIQSAIKKLFQIPKDRDISKHLQSKFQLAIQMQSHTEKLFNFSKLNESLMKDDKTKVIQNFESPEIKQTTIQKCLDSFVAVEYLYGQNEWFCPYCQKSVEATKKMQLYRTSDILVFVLNRFKITAEGKQKNNRPVTFPFQLDLQKYVQDQKPISCYIELMKIKGLYQQPSYDFKPRTDEIQKFELYAFIHHSGTLYGGHYVAFIEKNKRWYLCNDREVRQVELSKIDFKNAYIIFYRRKRGMEFS